jgi:DNA-binding transcriptional regulator GbsR (MarR family)
MDAESIGNGVSLADWELELLDIFVSMFDLFGLPKSTAQIYGVLYCSDESLMQEEIGRRLGISAGSASQGLRLLTNIGAVHRQSIPGQRQSSFYPERSMRRLMAYFIDAQLRPRLNSGKERLQHLYDNLPPDEQDAQAQVGALLGWQRKADKALPIISTLFGK